VHYQNLTELEPYMAAVAAGELPIKRAFRTSPEERMIREFILQMKLGHVNLGYFTEKFGVDIAQRFQSQLAHLGEEGLLKVSADEVKLSRDGLLCVDTLLHEFFLQQHRTTQIV
jgi:oxygen-independent coproporphyrinogen-3 oxidase